MKKERSNCKDGPHKRERRRKRFVKETARFDVERVLLRSIGPKKQFYGSLWI